MARQRHCRRLARNGKPAASLLTPSSSEPRTPAGKARVLDARKWLRERDGLSAGGSEIRTLRPRKRGTMFVETGTVRFQPVSDLTPVFGRSRKHFCLKADLNGAETSGLNLSAGQGLSDAVVYAELLYCAS